MIVLLLLLSCGTKDAHIEQQAHQHSYTQKHKLFFMGSSSLPKSDRLDFTSEKPTKVKLTFPVSVVYADSFTPTLYSTDED